jgi:hypothetical protein
VIDGLRLNQYDQINKKRLFSVKKKTAFLVVSIKMVRPSRFELLAHSFGDYCSIQLSYGRKSLIIITKPAEIATTVLRFILQDSARHGTQQGIERVSDETAVIRNPIK